MMRKGLTKGSGKKGYYNIIGKDPMVHRMSAKGIKQPQQTQNLNQLKKEIETKLNLILEKQKKMRDNLKKMSGGKSMQTRCLSCGTIYAKDRFLFDYCPICKGKNLKEIKGGKNGLRLGDMFQGIYITKISEDGKQITGLHIDSGKKRTIEYLDTPTGLGWMIKKGGKEGQMYCDKGQQKEIFALAKEEDPSLTFKEWKRRNKDNYEFEGESKGGKLTAKQAETLDDFLKKHPKLSSESLIDWFKKNKDLAGAAGLGMAEMGAGLAVESPTIIAMGLLTESQTFGESVRRYEKLNNQVKAELKKKYPNMPKKEIALMSHRITLDQAKRLNNYYWRKGKVVKRTK